MIDDIVINLRDFAHIVDKLEDRARIIMVSGEVFSQAADEIERLREQVDYWKQVAEQLADAL